MSGIRIMNSSAPAGQERMMIMNDVSGGQLRLFPGSNQVVLAGLWDGANRSTYKSYDSGDSYVLQPDSFPGLISDNQAISFNNRYYYVGDPSTINGDYWLAQSSDFAASWSYDVSNAVSSQRFNYVASSRDGKYTVATSGGYNVVGDMVFSDDFGETWTHPIGSQQWYRPFVSPDGQNIVIGGNAYTNPTFDPKYSDDYGQTWGDVPLGSISTIAGTMISGDENYKVIWEQIEDIGQQTKARVFVSTDWINWDVSALITERCSGGDISNDGKYILIAASDGYNGEDNVINLSSDYGQTWEQKPLGVTEFWFDCAMSSDGKYMIVVPGIKAGTENYPRKSIDYGETWTEVTDMPNARYYGVEMSKSGRYIYAYAVDEGVTHSTDYMASWTQNFDGSTGQAVFINF